MIEALPFSPLIYEFGNSWLSSLGVLVVLILLRFLAIEVYESGWLATYQRMRVKFALSICAVACGDASLRAWTWWGRLCSNTAAECSWMTLHVWPLVPALSIVFQAIGWLCMIRVLTPGVWGPHAWVWSGVLSLSWAAFWFSGWDQILTYFGI